MKGRRLLLAALLASLAVAGGAAPARADDEIALSLDGQTWVPALTAPLFERDLRWVPGDVETRSFYVRNLGPTDSRLLISVVASGDDQLVDDDDVALAVRAEGGPWASLDNGDDVAPLVREPVDRGDAVRVDVRAAFRWSSSNQTMIAKLPLRIEVVLREDVGDGGDGDGDDGGGGTGGLLPGTGSSVPWWLVAVAGGGVAAGVTLVVAGRRREAVDDG